MFDIDRWEEIFISIRENLLRTALAGITISLGLYIFILLFGIGNGLQNGFMSQFIDDATNIIFIGTGKTSKAYSGYQEGRSIQFDNDDFKYINHKYKTEVEYATARKYDNVTAKYNAEYGNYSVRAVHPDHQFLEKSILVKGRYLSDSDLVNREKYAVIGILVEKDLFKNTSALGKNIVLDGISFRVIGVFRDEGGDDEERMIYLPLTTQQSLDKGTHEVDQINLTYNQSMSPDQAIKFGEELKTALKKRMIIHPEDQAAIWMRNNAENMGETFAFLLVITGIVTFIGIGTLIAGVIGISNIMIYIVKERTKEIGIRKALGAKPLSVISLILQESVVITLLSGLIGVIAAIGTLNLIGDSLKDFFIINPSVGTFHILSAFVFLVSGGLLAGFIPARRAAKIKPIEALRIE